MISLLLTVICLVLYVGLRYFLSQIRISDGSFEYKKSNQFSSFIYFCGVAYLIYKVNKHSTSPSNVVIHSLISVAASIIALDVMMTIIWGKIETMMLEVFPKCLHKIMNKIGYDFESDIPFVLLLWAISISFVLFAHRSDIILEMLFNSSDEEEVVGILELTTDEEEEDRISENTIEDRQEDFRFQEQGAAYKKYNYRGVTTLPSEFKLPDIPRRSLRSRTRQRRFSHQE